MGELVFALIPLLFMLATVSCCLSKEKYTWLKSLWLIMFSFYINLTQVVSTHEISMVIVLEIA